MLRRIQVLLDTECIQNCGLIRDHDATIPDGNAQDGFTRFGRQAVECVTKLRVEAVAFHGLGARLPGRVIICRQRSTHAAEATNGVQLNHNLGTADLARNGRVLLAGEHLRLVLHAWGELWSALAVCRKMMKRENPQRRSEELTSTRRPLQWILSHFPGLQDKSTTPVPVEQRLVQLDRKVICLRVERNLVRAALPDRKWVHVARVDTIRTRVDTNQPIARALLHEGHILGFVRKRKDPSLGERRDRQPAFGIH
eukprot:3472394-Prymnesium_polylepis.2